MATELSREELRRLARIGAQRRLEELRQEEAAIRAAFPELSRAGGAEGAGPRRRGSRGTATEAPQAESATASARRRRRPRMTAAQKRAVSERMKKYWAARRKAKE